MEEKLPTCLYDDLYTWDGKRYDNKDPISWFPGSCRLKIIDLRSSNPDITFLKPYICIFSQSSEGHSISVNPEKFARRICADFSLSMEQVLWVEAHPLTTGDYTVLAFSKSIDLGSKTLFALTKRAPTPGELDFIELALNT